ncbi:ribonuclease PH [Candidatus Babeliales bacterium]|nr:ribonuclease PH [Candidatus Babeliales bacterium]
MFHSVARADGRACDQLRPLSIRYGVYTYADGSVLYQLGGTKILCSAKLQTSVPPFLKGKNQGWVTAEYAMLPAATPVRTQRDSSAMKRNGRSVEISRIIGRALRSVVRLDLLGERTFFIDCDVMQADGGTRTASITGAYLALRHAVTNLVAKGALEENVLKDDIAAISVGVSGATCYLDLDCCEDMALSADFNFVLTRSGDVIEIQGTSESKPISWEHFDAMRILAIKGVRDIFAYVDMNSDAKELSAIKEVHNECTGTKTQSTIRE